MLAPNIAVVATEDREGTLVTVIDTIPALVWSARPDGSAEFFNQRWLHYAGLTFDRGCPEFS